MQRSPNIVRLEIRQFLKHGLRGQTISKEIQDIAYPDPHPPDARPAATLFWVDRYPIGQIAHIPILPHSDLPRPETAA